MAQRRMFSKDIVRSDAFLDLPITAQCLYFQLGMDTDDRGYIPNGKSVLRLLQANKGDLEILIAKRFLLVRKDGTILLQKHFKTNNYIRPDRFHETNYLEDLALLYYDENGNYTDNETDLKVLGYQVVGNCPTEDKLSKDKLGKDNISKDNKIKLDKTRYKQKEFLQMLVDCSYLNEYDIEDSSYDNFFTQLRESYEYTDIKIKLEYFISTLTHIETIKDKYNYLTTSLINSFKRFENGRDLFRKE